MRNGREEAHPAEPRRRLPLIVARSYLLTAAIGILSLWPGLVPCGECSGTGSFPTQYRSVRRSCSECDVGKVSLAGRAKGALGLRRPDTRASLILDLFGTGSSSLGELGTAFFRHDQETSVFWPYWPRTSVTRDGAAIALLLLGTSLVFAFAPLLTCTRPGPQCATCQGRGVATLFASWVPPGRRRLARVLAGLALFLAATLVSITTYPIVPCPECPKIRERNRGASHVIECCSRCDEYGSIPLLDHWRSGCRGGD